MKSSSSSSSSCFGTALLLIVILAILRFASPEIWKILLTLTAGAVSVAVMIFLALLGTIGYFTYKNFKKNQSRSTEMQTGGFDRTDQLYQSVVERLQKDIVLNQVSAEELLQSEVLVSEKLKDMKVELVRLQEFASSQNRAQVEEQIRDYKRKLQASRDSAVQQVMNENIRMLEEKRNRIEDAMEEIRQKEASMDLVYHTLRNVEDNLKFGRSVQQLFPDDLYRRFGLVPPSKRDSLPPLTQKSTEE
jgi:predicted negative regulator of RcsB-dependent stress response